MIIDLIDILAANAMECSPLFYAVFPAKEKIPIKTVCVQKIYMQKTVFKVERNCF